MFTELNLVTGQSEFGKLRRKKESCIDAKNSATLLISNLVVQKYFQVVFHCEYAENLMLKITSKMLAFTYVLYAWQHNYKHKF